MSSPDAADLSDGVSSDGSGGGWPEWRSPEPLSSAERLWQADNLVRIRRHIKGLSHQPDDTLFSGIWAGHFVVVTKSNGYVRLWLIDEETTHTRWYQSELDMTRPLRPSFGYLRGMLLALLWQPSPQRLFFGGLGGGILPTVMHHYLPAAQIDCVEIAPPVIEAARSYFPLPQDDRMQIWNGDVLAFLHGQALPSAPATALRTGGKAMAQPKVPPKLDYDLIFLDIFLDHGRMPDYMADEAFFAASKRRMGSGAILGLNLHAPPDDPRRGLLTNLFATVVNIPMKKNHSLLLATDSPRLSLFERAARLQQIYQIYGFEFSVKQRLEKLTYLD